MPVDRLDMRIRRGVDVVRWLGERAGRREDRDRA
jgi:hypothetical protein